jgi:DNA-binding CsgD family transcriptional regulator
VNHRHVIHTPVDLNAVANAEMVSPLSAMTSLAFESISWGMAVMTGDGQLGRVNAAMRAIAADRDGIRLSPRGVAFHDPVHDRALRDIVAALQTQDGTQTQCVPVWMSISRLSGKRPYAVAVSSLNAADATGSVRPPILIRVSDPERAADIRTDVLQRLFRLTAAEARLTAALMRGGCLAAAAEICGLTEGSARQYIRRIFAKTGTASQVQLVVRIARAVQF